MNNIYEMYEKSYTTECTVPYDKRSPPQTYSQT